MSIPQSLPSFAQAFSNSSLSDIAPISNALPPIQSRHAHSPPRTTTKKRSREDPPLPPRTDRAPVDAHNADGTRQSPLAVRIKEEDRDDSQRPPQSPPQLSRDTSATPGVQPLSKKRRVTVSGPPHGPSTIRASAEQGTPIPISPVVTTLPVPDDAVPRDQPRPILVKQQQITLVDQRRGSISAVMSSTGACPMVSGSLLSRSPPGDQLTTSKLSRIGRISPSTVSVANRCAGNAVASGSQVTTSATRPLTPPPIIVSSQQPSALALAQNAAEPASKSQQFTVAHSLPPPPISFARRRAAQPGGRKKKPADIMISPRGAGPSDPLAPVIQSAPPVADPGRFPMVIPRLPLVLNSTQSTRRVAGNVPPTPTRFSLQGTTAPLISSTARAILSPPNPSVPIANTLVPPTPHALQHPGYTGDKSAFLAPFEVFFDALNDSKQSKGWLSDQMQKSNVLMASLKQQQEKMDEIVEDLVEKRTRVMREEITMLRQRMESLEEALLAVRAEASAKGQDGAGYGYPQGGKFHQNGIPPCPEAPSSYRFPAPEQRRPDAIIKVTSPGREQEHQPSSSPPVEVTRRLSISTATVRPEPPQALHGSFILGGHNRVVSGSQGSAKSTAPVRPQAIPERTSAARQTDSRPAARLYFAGSYGNSNPPIEGQASSRGGDKS
ncbi:hypothetical protein J3R82DRAFT_9483 [Butyriboletus roseoflavus]|nr:hypothetical protein J3R82DRAFT_9483 [Butyriboletus roseoflavus]